MTRPESSDIGERHDAAADMRRLAEGIAPPRTVALVGLMGAGKSTIGRRLAHALDLPFADADTEIEHAAGRTIPEIFAQHGEPEFRRGERAVIERLLDRPAHILATGGGAFIDPRTRALMKERAITIWLKAPLDVLMKRVSKRDDRPLLKEDDPRAVMQRLMDARYPIYAEADIIIETVNSPHSAAVASALEALRTYLNERK
ncbi:MAG TPA: shikimate kinase [Verrucomicrobiae bacterium]|nr:shikimate kinase [Verrucomicrobiae bacterium]